MSQQPKPKGPPNESFGRPYYEAIFYCLVTAGVVVGLLIPLIVRGREKELAHELKRKICLDHGYLEYISLPDGTFYCTDGAEVINVENLVITKIRKFNESSK
jgi:hypothetical protein